MSGVTNDVFMNTYHRQPVVFASGDGAWLTDTSGKKYLDFGSGIAVNCLGHNYGPLVKAVSEQAAKIMHVCNYYQSDVSAAFAEKLVEACAPAGMKKVFLCNSGAEANEGAVKIARKYSLDTYGPGRHTIVTLKKSFHGRTITTLSATGQDIFHKNFGPFTEGFVHIEADNIAELEKALDQKTVAGFLLEEIQGEGGIWPASDEFVGAAAKLCAERDILLMFDEVQCGMGRTGTFLACEKYGVKPDVVTLAKGIAGGIPAGAVLAGEKAAGVLQVGDHGTTFGGNALASAAGLVVLETVNNPAFLAEIARKGEKFAAIIKGWNHPKVKEIRGRGLIIGADITVDAAPLLDAGIALAAAADTAVAADTAAAGKGLLFLTAGKQTLRFLPPYIVSDGEIETGLAIIKELLDKAQ